jgi:hypothetical protein
MMQPVIVGGDSIFFLSTNDAGTRQRPPFSVGTALELNERM